MYKVLLTHSEVHSSVYYLRLVFWVTLAKLGHYNKWFDSWQSPLIFSFLDHHRKKKSSTWSVKSTSKRKADDPNSLFLLWRCGWVVECTCCFFRGLGFGSRTHLEQLTATCTFSSRGSDALVLPPLSPSAYSHTNTCTERKTNFLSPWNDLVIYTAQTNPTTPLFCLSHVHIFLLSWNTAWHLQ